MAAGTNHMLQNNLAVLSNQRLAAFSYLDCTRNRKFTLFNRIPGHWYDISLNSLD